MPGCYQLFKDTLELKRHVFILWSAWSLPEAQTHPAGDPSVSILSLPSIPSLYKLLDLVEEPSIPSDMAFAPKLANCQLKQQGIPVAR